MKLTILLLLVFVFACSAQRCGDGVCSTSSAENKVNCPDDCDDICPCRPYCTGRECGPDGCGGTCGTCSAGRTCTGAGRCICNRNCIGKECGDDGCSTGDVCDFCGVGQTCGSDFLCRGACTPNCRNTDGSLRECGNDGCFGSCGECAQISGQDIRCRNGRCVCRPQCDQKQCGSDGCGGDCGVCSGDATCVNGTCVFPTLGCCGDGICDAATENTCNCHTDCRGCCVNGNCEEEFGETETNCIADCVNALLIEVRERPTNILVTETCSIAITGPNSYSATLSYRPNSISWEFQSGGFGTYTFVTTCPSYLSSTATHTITSTTTLITLLVDLRPLLIEVRDGQTNALVSSASIRITAQFGGQTSNQYQWNSPSISWTPFSGYGNYQFVTTSTGYLEGRETKSVTLSTTLITLFLFRNSLPFIVEDCSTRVVLTTSTVQATSTTYSSFSSSFTVSGSTTQFTHVGYGSYSFVVSSSGYTTKTTSAEVQQSTSEIRVCLDRSAFCGDGVCNSQENAVPTSTTRCFDCGRLRGVISLAVGQKDQLVNITVSVWPHPTNPATIMRAGQQLPTPAFTTTSDSKGFFSVNSLSFDAPSGSQAAGQYKRRYYFRLSGSFVDRTTGQDQVVNLLSLWWNYELTNTQWSGQGDLTNTNNSPSFYFYMTPGFSTNDALIRIILSWGNLISNPANTIPDLDLVIAGPVTQESIALFGNGIVNFANKDAHAATGTNVLPYAKIITDSAQGYGPEVFDFYGVPGSSTLQIGFSPSYNPGAAANAYEIWVDRPNSSPNTDNSFTFIYDTNSFIVVYYNDGTKNEQQLFDARTGVEYAYGFYNRDQWNRVPTDATLWHIIDISQAEQGIKWTGFPGENGQDKSEQPGAKYAYNAAEFVPNKSIPCGHTASRGANPPYCPAILTYPQTKK